MGKGKTTLAVYLARMLALINPSLELRANFHVIGLPKCEYVTIDEFLRIDDVVKPKLTLIDEPYAWSFDSRRSSVGTNLALTTKLLQSRHYNMDIIFITQLPSSMDKRGRMMSDYVILALFPSENCFNYAFFGQIAEPIRLYLPIDEAKRQAFPYFNTREIIKEAYSEKYLKQMVEDLGEDKS